jgi:D-amino-acid dehydrogenase
MLRWLMAMLANCTAGRYAINKSRMVRLAEFSRDRLIDLRAETGIRYDERSRGTLQLFRDPRQLDGIAKDVDVLRADGVPFEVLDAKGCIAAEPGLAHSDAAIAGGLRLPNDETGDCFKFTQALAALAAHELGVRFLYDHSIERLVVDGNGIDRAVINGADFRADAFVLALGSFSPLLVRPLGIRLPVYPVKGYSITAQILDEARAPVSTLLDESYKIAITRLGDRIRVGGMAEISGYGMALPAARRGTLDASVGSLFPGGGDLEDAQFWCGLRPMTPDGTPIIGATGYRNLFLNTGHGTLGWTMACGSAQVLADLISGREAAIETADLSINRYQ